MLVGALALAFRHQPVFTLSVWLHSMTFVFLGMFVAASAGDILFNKEETDILLHRPVEPQALLWAKIGTLVQVSLWLAGALNLVGLWIGATITDGGWRFAAVHVASTVLEALFCTGFVVVVYQLCLRWFGRERLDGLMTSAQVVVAVAAVLAGQLLPQLVARFRRYCGPDRRLVVDRPIAAGLVCRTRRRCFGNRGDVVLGACRAGRTWHVRCLGDCVRQAGRQLRDRLADAQ